jgi:thymidylate synthase ThyX
MELLCKKCDVFVGFAADGVARRPEEHKDDKEWLTNHCWVCGRSREEIEANPHDRQPTFTIDKVSPTRNLITGEIAEPATVDDLWETRVETPIDRYVASYTGSPRGGVVKDVAFNRKSFGEGQPENPDQGAIWVGQDGIEVTLEQDFNDQELAHFFSYAINATRGIDPRNPPDATDWEEMMRGGLQTALKRINIAFAVYGASRTATHQLVRSTRANFHQQSQRAHYYGDRPSVRMPESFLKTVLLDPNDDPSDPHEVNVAKEYQRLAEHSAAFYRMATDAGVSYQDARFGLLEGTTNFILCEYSLDEFIAVYAYRGCSMFQWEIVSIMREMRRVLIEAHPWLEPYIKISCERTKGAKDKTPVGAAMNLEGEAVAHTCTYQGWEEVEGQCDFPWARESNRSFRSQRHVIKDKTKS